MQKKQPTEDIIYQFVCENPGNCTYTISKRLKMSGGRVRNALIRLKQMGLVKFKFDRHNPRIRKLTYPVRMWRLVPKTLKRDVKKISRK
ncbi:MAG: hypothetical protein ACE5J3_05190 [Methanosarcinales archaeon]